MRLPEALQHDQAQRNPVVSEARPPAVYRHFKSRDELVLRVCEKAFREFDEQVRSTAASEPDPLRALRGLAAAYVEFGRRHPEHYRILFLSCPDEAARRAAPSGDAGLVAFTHLHAAVLRCIEAGQLPEQDATRTALCLWAAMHGLTSLLVSMPGFPSPPVEELVEKAVDIQLGRLGTVATGGRSG